MYQLCHEGEIASRFGHRTKRVEVNGHSDTAKTPSRSEAPIVCFRAYKAALAAGCTTPTRSNTQCAQHGGPGPGFYLASSHVRTARLHASRIYSMPSPTPHNLRKRQRAEPAQVETASQPMAKRQRAERDRGWQASAAFWDNLSKVWLTSRALEELDRRTLSARPSRRAHRLDIECSAADSGAARRSAQYIVDPLSGCSARTARRIK